MSGLKPIGSLGLLIGGFPSSVPPKESRKKKADPKESPPVQVSKTKKAVAKLKTAGSTPKKDRPPSSIARRGIASRKLTAYDMAPNYVEGADDISYLEDIDTAEGSPTKGKRKPKVSFDPETANKVHLLAQHGMPNDQIGVVVDVTKGALTSHYQKYLTKGRCEGNAEISKTLYEKAVKGDNACLIFLSKVRLGYRDVTVQKVDVVNSDNSLQPVTNVTNVMLTAKDIAKIAKLCDVVDWDVDGAENEEKSIKRSPSTIGGFLS